MKKNSKVEYERPCEATKVGCTWIHIEEYDDFGQMISWDAECQHCFRRRDWSKSEYVPQWLHP